MISMREGAAVSLGRATVLAADPDTATAECLVTRGLLGRGTAVRCVRGGREIHRGAVARLKLGGDVTVEVREGRECGLKLAAFDDLRVGDVIEAYRTARD